MAERIVSLISLLLVLMLVPGQVAFGAEKPVTRPTPTKSIVIDLRTNTLRLLDPQGKTLKEYPVASGRSGLTPLGSFKIVNAAKYPTWSYNGRVVPGGIPQNPLGSRWLGLSWVSPGGNRIGIHGTNAPSSIGKHVSNGCIRMQNKDVEELFLLVEVGVPVTILKSPAPATKPAANQGKKPEVKPATPVAPEVSPATDPSEAQISSPSEPTETSKGDAVVETVQ